jgi:hypothetical protein
VKPRPEVLAVVIPASVFQRLVGRMGGEDIGGESKGLLASANSGASAGAAEAELGDGLAERAPRNGGVCCCSGEPNPGGLEMVEAEGAIRLRARRACALASSMEMGEKAILAEDDGLRPRVSSRTGGQLPLEEDEDGHTAVGEPRGSGEPGGVSAALERRLLSLGDAERTRDRPRRPRAAGARAAEAAARRAATAFTSGPGMPNTRSCGSTQSGRSGG